MFFYSTHYDNLGLLRTHTSIIDLFKTRNRTIHLLRTHNNIMGKLKTCIVWKGKNNVNQTVVMP